MSGATGKLTRVAPWLPILSFGVNSALTAMAVYYGNLLIGLLVLLFFNAGALLYGVHRTPALFEDMESANERKRSEATREFIFLFLLFYVSLFSYVALLDVFFNALSTVELTIAILLPTSIGTFGLGTLFYELMGRP